MHHLFVDPHFTRRGIGTALLHKRLSAIGRPASLKCIQRNIEAIAFYQSQGWQIMSSGTSTEGKYYLMVFLEDS
ncbi:GNAT family N-acetyltransferase [Acaryochloris sp. IP29b_bin.148]|uniref:GNAT family N-acetyltransferase n=1 Tax=Acaryochloris sp. IP29b_bin.148 TaxID=2969218 RepID=UPI00262CFAA9|nr:GNAT family N-acetyltransferase [Acaryochloris sp. IP29b_bin.148]